MMGYYKKYIRILSLCGVMMCCWNVSAQSLEEKARNVAQEFLQLKNDVCKRSSSELKLIYSTPKSFVFSPQFNPGFVWVSQVDGEPVVCGYAMDVDVNNTPIPTALEAYIKRGVYHIEEFGATEPIKPLLSSTWDQIAPYNGMCPYYKYDNGKLSSTRCKVGCVATATSEVMRFYEWPEMLQDTLYGWGNSHYEISDVLPGTRIDWANILDDYDGEYSAEEAKAVQELALYCGMACKMNYGVNASGSNTYKMLSPLESVFGYKYVAFYDRSYYSPRQWRELLQYELRRGVPLVYAGYNMNFSGHAFVVDGLDENGFYHICWGEGGVFNGYFNIDFMNAYEPHDKPTEIGMEMGHFCNQSVLAFHPDSLSAFPGDTLTYKAEEIVVDQVQFTREPDTNGYVTVDVQLTNHSADTITYTLLAYTTFNEDSVDWNEADAVGITAVTLYPNEKSSARIHCQFEQAGPMFWGLTADEDYILYQERIDVKDGGDFSLSFPTLKVLQLESDAVSFEVTVVNRSEVAYASDMLTYCFSEKGEEKYESQWFQFVLPPQETVIDTVCFCGLKPNTSYQLQVRYPWTIVNTCEMTTPVLSIHKIKDAMDAEYDVYSMQGIKMMKVVNKEDKDRFKALPKGVYIWVEKRGKTYKIWNE